MKGTWTSSSSSSTQYTLLSILICILSHCPPGLTVSDGITRDTTTDDLNNEVPNNVTTSTQTKEKRFDECVLLKSNTTYSARVMESYLELGYYDIMRDVDISFDVLPDRYSHNGPLFSIGTEDFQYYEWKTKAFETQYFVIEFVYSAMSMLLKALMEPHMKPMEICRTFPHPYDIGDGQWHHIRARRENRRSDPDVWFLALDDIEINQTVNSGNNVFLQDRPAYLGGRPGFRSYQFRGVIKNFEVKGERVPLRGRATYGLVEVWHCSAPEVKKFIDSIQAPPLRSRSSMGRPRRPPGRESEDRGTEGKEEEEKEKKEKADLKEKGEEKKEEEVKDPVTPAPDSN